MNKKTVLVTAGPTREYIDPVRFITNASSGLLGYTIAETFSKKFNVILVSGPTLLKPKKNIKFYQVETSQQMFNVVKKIFSKTDIFIATAAVCDYKIKNFSKTKIKKQNKQLKLSFIPTVDILKYCGKHKTKNQILVGFALETDNGLKNAIKKLKDKKLDYIVLNSPESMSSKYIKATIIDKKFNITKLKKITKLSFAKKLLRILWTKTN